MRVFSRIYKSEAHINRDRGFGERTIYYPVWIRHRGKWRFALFTDPQIDVATARGDAQREDLLPRARAGFLEALLRRVGWR